MQAKPTLSSANFIPHFIIIALIALYYSTAGTFDLWQDGRLSAAYDSLAKNLIHLEANLDAEAIGWEAFDINGKHYMYFGLLPALPRILLNAINNGLYGKWTYLSINIAYIFALFAIVRMIILALSQNTYLNSQAKYWIASVSLFASALASPLFYLLSDNSIYHEAIIWALAFALHAIYYFLKYYYQDNKLDNIIIFVILSGLALLTRITFAVPLLLILPFWLVCEFAIKKTQKKSKLILVFLPLILSFAIQGWYNQARFGSPTKFSDDKYYRQGYEIKNPQEKQKLLHKIQTLKTFDLARIPDTFKAYFGIEQKIHLQIFPYLKFYRPTLEKRSEFTYVRAMFPLILTTLWLIAFALIATPSLFKQSNPLLCIFAVSLLVQAVMILAYRAVIYRYIAEFLPLFMYMFFFYLHGFGKYKIQRSKIIWFLQILLIVVSLWFTVISSIYWRGDHALDGKYNLRINCKKFFFYTDAWVMEHNLFLNW